MAKYLVFIEGWDAMASATAITRSQLRAMVHDAQFASDIGGIILAPAAPDVSLYPMLARFRWAETFGGSLTGKFYWHDGTSWTLEVPADGTITGDMLENKSITIGKLKPEGDPFQIIQIRSDGEEFQYIDITDAIKVNSLPLNRLVNASAAYSFMVSDATFVWNELGAGPALGKLLPAATSAVTFNSFVNDTVPIFRVADTTAEAHTVAYFTENQIIQSPLIGSTLGPMLVPVVDLTAAAGSRAKHVSLTNLLPPSGVAAGVYTGNLTVTVGVNGLITAISASSGSTYSTAVGAEVALPTAQGWENRASIPHGLSAKPRFYTAFIVCTDIGGDAGYVHNHEEPLSVLRGDTGSAAYNIAFGITADATNIYVTRPRSNSALIGIMNNDTGAQAQIVTTKWKLRGYATL